MKTMSEASAWNSGQVRRWLENQGFREFWPFLEPHAPVTGQDLLCLTADDWHKLVDEPQVSPAPTRPSVIKIRRLVNQVSKLKLPAIAASTTNGSAKHVLSDEDSFNNSDDDPSDGEHPISPRDLACPYCNNQALKLPPLDFKPERWKTLLAFLYVLLVSWVTAFVMVIVHDRVPDMEKYPPLPDIILDNIPHIPWAFEMCEFTGMILISVWFLVVLFHKHRFILMRRCVTLPTPQFL